jgi:hypothetical protein
MTRASSKFFTPPLSNAERITLFDVLGLSALDYRFMECSPTLVLRVLEYGNGTAAPKVQPWLLADWETRGGDENPLILKRISGWALEKRGVWAESFGATLFPFPFSLIGNALSTPSKEGMMLFPVSFENECKRLWAAFERLEVRLSEGEIGFLWIANENKRFPLIVHTVRQKRVRVGTARRLEEVGRAYEEGNLTDQMMHAYFPTRVSFVPLTVHHDKEFSVITNLYTSIERALAQPSALSFLPGSSALSSSSIDLML